MTAEDRRYITEDGRQTQKIDEIDEINQIDQSRAEARKSRS
jgi:hypothetical protein